VHNPWGIPRKVEATLFAISYCGKPRRLAIG